MCPSNNQMKRNIQNNIINFYRISSLGQVYKISGQDTSFYALIT